MGVQVKTKYDAEGRVIQEGYPFRSGDTSGNSNIFATIEDDALGRVTKRTGPDTKFSRSYSVDGVVTLEDENNPARVTVQAWEAVGDPNEARLATLVDADDKTWTYTYNALGRLLSASHGSVTRTWEFYEGMDLLERETHPESGVTSYGYDAGGVLTTKTDANDITTTYAHDGNDRVTKVTAGTRETAITYEPGSDNRETAINAFAGIQWTYDGLTGRLQRRRDTIGEKAFTTVFEYDNDDHLMASCIPQGGE